ncbi:hypothetical protein D3C72_2368550 [compost metagenome]
MIVPLLINILEKTLILPPPDAPPVSILAYVLDLVAVGEDIPLDDIILLFSKESAYITSKPPVPVLYI